MIPAFDTRELEERGFNAWPSCRTVYLNGWLVRISGGLTKRANSANALAPSGPFSDVKTAVENIYEREALPPIFRITPLVDKEIDRVLERDGYAVRDECLVMTALKDAFPKCTNLNVVLGHAPDRAWLDGVAQANFIVSPLREIHDRIVLSIPLPSAFATAYVDGHPAGFAMAVIDRGMVGIFDVVVKESVRGQGIGRGLTARLLHWGAERGAYASYLQTLQSNAIARTLYSKLGYREAYRYYYRCHP
jgi:N-acetylglutamate synthase